MASKTDTMERWLDAEAEGIQEEAEALGESFKAQREAAKCRGGDVGYLILRVKPRRSGASIVWGRLRKIGGKYVVADYRRGRNHHYDLKKIERHLQLHAWERQAFQDIEMAAAALRERTERLASVSRAMAAYCKASGTSWRRPDDPDEDADSGADE